MPRLTDLLRAAGIGAHVPDCEISAITADSRQVIPGALFVAIPGTKAQGADFIADAVARGAAAVVSESSPANVQAIVVPNARLALAKLAAAFYPQQPDYLVGITGTNGKTSTAEFFRQLWALGGHPAASMGTLGLRGAALDYPEGLTSPDAVLLHRTLDALARQGVRHAAIECSSHGLDQHRLDGARFTAAAFTNLTRDHLDYHGTMDRYFAAKQRLFTDFPLSCAVINADDAYGRRLIAECTMRVVDYGRNAEALRLLALQPTAQGLSLRVSLEGKERALSIPVYGAFQAHNILGALGLALACGIGQEEALAHLPRLQGVRGRMEYVASHRLGAPIFVDYAHTPDALENVLTSLRAHTTGRLHLVFGCGGDRDAGKRPLMGAVAARLADVAIVTDDNPRSENPALIRAAIRASAPQLQEIGDRAQAIVAAIQQLNPNDALIVAGKGHETYQIIGNTRYDFDDARVIKEALNTL